MGRDATSPAHRSPEATDARQRRGRGKRLSASALREAVLVRAAETLLGARVSSVEHPGGRSRESYRLLREGAAPVIATRRDALERARLEVRALRALNRHGARVPHLLATNHSRVLIQSELVGPRLSLALREADRGGDRARVRKLLDAALDSLAGAQHAAHDEGLEARATVLGRDERWRRALVARPQVIGAHLHEPAPALDVEALVHRLRVVAPRFIKWDARPGNAAVSPDGGVHWFDWEHAGARNRLDDAAWLLGDEFVPEDAEGEMQLLHRRLPAFAEPMGLDDARDYFHTFGAFHEVVRLGLVLKHMDGEWWDLDACIERDKVGVTLDCALRLCRRGARWASRSAHARPLADWFARLEPRLRAL